MTLHSFDLPDALWCACASGIGGGVLGALGLLTLPARVRRPQRYAVLVAFTLAGLAGAAGFLQKPLGLWFPGLLVSVAWLLFRVPSLLGLGGLAGLTFRLFQDTRCQIGLLLAGGALVLLGLALPPAGPDIPIHHSATPLPARQSPDAPTTRVVSAATDWGTPIPLLSISPQEPVPSLAAIEQGFIHEQAPESSMINTGPADPVSNCHGWVFANGRYWIDGRQVPRILDENGYQQVSEPQAGDLCIFRNGCGEVMHTALVRLVTEDGLILLESKWGHLGRYIHRPNDLRFSRIFAYYRTTRRGHLLRGVDGLGPTATLPQVLRPALSA